MTDQTFNPEARATYIQYLIAVQEEKNPAKLFNKLSYTEYCLFKGLVAYIDKNHTFKFDKEFRGKTEEYTKLGGTNEDGLKNFIDSEKFKDFRTLVEQEDTSLFKYRSKMRDARDLYDRHPFAVPFVVGIGVGIVSRIALTAVMGSFAPALLITGIAGGFTGGVLAAWRVCRHETTRRLRNEKPLTFKQGAWEIMKGIGAGAAGAIVFSVGLDMILSGLSGQAYSGPSTQPANATNGNMPASNATAGNTTLDTPTSTDFGAGNLPTTPDGGSAATGVSNAASGVPLDSSGHPMLYIKSAAVPDHWVSAYDFVDPNNAHADLYSRLSPHDVVYGQTLASYGVDPCNVHVNGQDFRDALTIVSQDRGVYLSADSSTLYHTPAYMNAYNGGCCDTLSRCATAYHTPDISSCTNSCVTNANCVTSGYQVYGCDYLYDGVRPTSVIHNGHETVVLTRALNPCHSSVLVTEHPGGGITIDLENSSWKPSGCSYDNSAQFDRVINYTACVAQPINVESIQSAGFGPQYMNACCTASRCAGYCL